MMAFASFASKGSIRQAAVRTSDCVWKTHWVAVSTPPALQLQQGRLGGLNHYRETPFAARVTARRRLCRLSCERPLCDELVQDERADNQRAADQRMTRHDFARAGPRQQRPENDFEQR
jgi:hypothetical protein